MSRGANYLRPNVTGFLILQERCKYLSLVKSNFSGLLSMLRSDWLSYYSY